MTKKPNDKGRTQNSRSEREITRPDRELPDYARCVRYLREKHAYSQQELANKAKLSRTTIYNIENGKYPTLRPSTERALADFFKVSVEDILRWPPSNSWNTSTPSAAAAHQEQRHTAIREIRARDVDPGTVVFGYDPDRPHAEITKGGEIRAAIKDGTNLVISGPTRIGKTHALLMNVIDVAPDATLFFPHPRQLETMLDVDLPNGQVVLFLDDVDRYLKWTTDSGYSFMGIIGQLREKRPSLMVVATIRDTHGCYALLEKEHVPSIAKIIELEFWTPDQGRMSTPKGMKFDEMPFDGTPDFIFPPDRIRLRYMVATPAQRAVLHALIFLREAQIWPLPPIRLVREIFSRIFQLDLAGFDGALSGLNDLGLLRIIDDTVSAHDGRLDLFTGWKPHSADWSLLRGALYDYKSDELLVAAAANRVAARDLGQAQAYLLDAIALNPRNATAHYRLGVVYLFRTKLSDAEASFRNAANCAVTWITPWQRILALQERENRTAEAATTTRRIRGLIMSRMAAGDTNVLQRHGFEILLETRDRHGALRFCNRILKVYEDQPLIHYYRGLLLDLTGKQGTDAYRRAVELDPTFGEAWISMAKEFAAEDKWNDATEACRGALNAGFHDSRVYEIMTRSLRGMKDAKAAATVARVGASFDSNNKRLWGEYDAGVRHMRRTPSAYGDDEELTGPPLTVEERLAYGAFLRKKGRLDEAIDIVSSACEMKPDSILHYCLALCYYYNNDDHSAEREVRLAIKLQNDLARPHLLLGSVLLRLHQILTKHGTQAQAAKALGLNSQQAFQRRLKRLTPAGEKAGKDS